MGFVYVSLFYYLLGLGLGADLGSPSFHFR